MTEAGKRLLAAAHEALAFAKGDADPGTYIVHAPPPAVDVKAIRNKMGMTQAEFGTRFGFGKARVRDWEQKRTRPTASDRVLLVTIDSDPKSVLRALEQHHSGPLEVHPIGAGSERIVEGPSRAPRDQTIKAPVVTSKARSSARKSVAG